jgi:F-box and leucine-rich repeat protein GRR1
LVEILLWFLLTSFSDCTLLTDMAVFELSGLPKLRRIGLVRVTSLTDEAIYALGARHATLERIHLSYCNNIGLVSITYLLQQLHKLTHLSLTGIPAFRSQEVQRFCRPPPPVSLLASVAW